MMTANLTRFLTGYLNKPFTPASCCLWLGEWWEANHGINPASELRASIKSDTDKLRLLAGAGGIEALVSEVAASVSAAPVDVPQRGDFGLVLTGIGAVGAIYSGGRYWAMRSETGVAFAKPIEVARAWAI